MTEVNEPQIPADDQEIASPTITHRVKFYQLNVDTHWEDKGTGHCTYQKGTDGKPDQIIVRSEEDNSILLTSQVAKRRLYQRQQDTLIVWTEDDNRDLALSFQDPSGCNEMWSCISKKQGPVGSMVTGEPENEDFASRNPTDISLPEPELSNLKEISDVLHNAHSLDDKDKLSAYIMTEGYMDKLMPLFETCEDLEDIADLHLLYNVLEGILALNDQQIVDLALQDEYITNVMGILEYNPKTPGLKAKHREFIQKNGDTKQAVEIKDEVITRKIKLSFRLEYLQSILLHSETSVEGLMGVISNMLYQIHLDIVNYIQNNHLLLSELFSVFKDPETPAEKRDDIIRFFHQLCNLTKTMQTSVRVNTFRSLAPYGFFELMCVTLPHENESFRTTSLNILASFTDLDLASVRSHIMLQSKDTKMLTKPLIEVIVEQAVKDADYGLKVQYFEILRLLLDPNNNPQTGPGNDAMSKQAPETDEFLSLFYDKYTKTLFKWIEDLEIKPIGLKGPIEPLEITSDQAQLYLYVCEFLMFAVRNHGFRSKYVLLSSDFFLKITQLYRSKYKHVKLAALRFFRTCIALSDEFYNRNLIKHNIFEPTIRVLLDTDGRDCLLNSACLELLEFIRKENIKPLIDHLINQFGSVLDTITYISTCQQLRDKYEENMKATEKTGNNDNVGDKSDAKTNTDDEEEEYFNGSDEEEVVTRAPLVSYDEDDTDDDEDEEAEEDHSQEDDAEENKTTSSTAKRTSKNKTESPEGSSSPPPFLSRKRKEAEEDEDDELAKRSSRQSSLSPKKMVIKAPIIKKMRTTQ
ncbi:component of IIS longevity pathway SMK-1-domain-containing protein [Mucor mucedo]|uniref:component of IIS longevity pathway SMK-1-domain-containing protein n=1 Tax=Mucor mucedo TaxID=29922 RepID=UPI00222104B1|nr:component of IIS longevity pathway SMK-1-domain-containing protein [Mucor mucedo]KAI7896594.1 component of IIS longevity pathway SMK-1-domain-containing protein [Mucor mucedo]